MSISNIFDIAGSAMSAQSLRLNTTASNLANAQSAASSTDQVYRARKPVFQAADSDAFSAMFDKQFEGESIKGVKVTGIVESQAPLDKRYEPSNSLADEQGYVTYPNVNVVEEMTDMMSASRSFQMNVEMMDSAKTMMQRLLTLGQ
jgi:flagellar basal-body rod protein FlgC